MKDVLGFMPRKDKRELAKIGDVEVEARYGRAHRYKGSLQIISKVGPNAKILDVGCGERRLNLPRILNLDVTRKDSLGKQSLHSG